MSLSIKAALSWAEQQLQGIDAKLEAQLLLACSTQTDKSISLYLAG